MRGKISVDELALKTTEAVLALGIGIHTAWNEYSTTFTPVVKLHQKYEKKEFDREVVTAYVQIVEKRMECGEISYAHYKALKRGVERLTEFYDTGKLEWSCPGRVSKFKLNKYFDKIIAEFLSRNDFHHNTRGDIVWVAKKYFAWLIQQGFNNLRNVGVSEIQGFMIYCSQHLKSNSVHNVKLYMKKLYRYLHENGLAKDAYAGLFAFCVSRESRMFPAIPPEEIAMMLELIDRRVPKGKRDYAIILLAVVTGLRAIDIARLKLSDIDWERGEIRIVQSKTGKSLTLPLTKDVGEAIQDYILNGRQATESEEIFLRIHAPYQSFADGTGIGDMYEYYRKRAGLPREAFDGKGFHALRRALGRNMVTSGVPVTTVAQVLGDSNMDSAKKYISLDSEHLKECALNFSGIEPNVEAIQ